MKNPIEVASLAHDGPKAALWKMKKAGISSIFVQHKGKVQGIVGADDAVRALKNGDKDLTGILRTDITTVTPDTPASELFPLLAESSPVAVVSAERKLKGVIVKGSLLAALSEGVNNNGTS